MRAETRKALEFEDKCIQEFNSLLCDIRRFNENHSKEDVANTSIEQTVPAQVSKQIGNTGWLRSIVLAITSVLHTN